MSDLASGRDPLTEAFLGEDLSGLLGQANQHVHDLGFDADGSVSEVEEIQLRLDQPFPHFEFPLHELAPLFGAFPQYSNRKNGNRNQMTKGARGMIPPGLTGVAEDSRTLALSLPALAVSLHLGRLR